MLTEKQIEENKNRYLELVSSIKIEGADLTGFLNWLQNKSDFFFAPASTKYHCCYPGGLCEHSLNVYDCLLKLVKEFASKTVFESSETGESASILMDYSEDTIKLVALLHDISKANFYEQYSRNVKDEDGKWIQIKEYKTREPNNRFIFGSHEQTAEFIAHTFFPLSVEEAVAILHHHMGQSWDSAQDDVASVCNKYPLVTLLHGADLFATFLIERQNA